MKCVICKLGESRNGTATVTLEVKKATLVVKQVPARMWQNCGEQYVDEKITIPLMKHANHVANAGVHVDVR